MRWHTRLKYCLPLPVSLLLLSGILAQGQAVSVLTRNYNNQRTGANLSETSLSVANVNSSQFGKLFMLPVDDQVYAGILYVAGLQIAGGTHNVIYVATANNSVYAFDADSLGVPLWSRNFNGSGAPSTNAELGQNCNPYNDFRGDIGIVGTPVIDGTAGTIFFVTRTVLNGVTSQTLHALNIANGDDQPNSPQVIQASVSGNGDGGISVVFNPVTQNQRPALALSQGVVYIAWSSFCDTPPYHGWVLAYNSTSLAQLAAFSVTPNGTEGGIWMAGAGPAFDSAGNVFYGIGNGASDGATDFGESMVKLAPNSLTVTDYFTPSDFSTLNASDLDFGSSGPSMLPGANLLISGGKEGKLYLLNTTNLGQEVNGDVQIPQVFQAVDLTIRPTGTHHIHNASPIWNSPEGLNVYVWGENDFLHAFQFNTSKQILNTPAFATGSVLPPQGMPGGMMTISASASQAGTGIVWASVPRNGDANQDTTPGNLYAFNAENLNLLYSSTNPGDDLLNFSKGSAPIVSNGKLYVGSLSRFVEVYGLKTSGVYSQDLALNQTATGSAPCDPAETPSQAVNGSFSGGPDDKWCSSAASPYLMVDLGSPQTISRFVVEHAGAGGESLSLNTAAFNIQVSSDGVNFTTVVTVTGNLDSITTHDIAPTIARYVQLNIVSPTLSGSPPASIYEFQVFGPPAAGSPDFSLLEETNTQTVVPGAAASFTAMVGPLYGFTGTVLLGATGLPAGATASFNPGSVSGSGTSTLNILTASNTPIGSYTVTITGASGNLQHSTTVTLVVDDPGSPANLSAAYNRVGILTDGSTSTSTGLDQFGNAYSADLLGAGLNFEGLAFTFGPANVPDAVSSATVPLPAGSYSTLAFLGTAVNGSQASQQFIVNYTDGTNTTFVQGLSDWGAPQNYPGESVAVSMPYRDTVNGAQNFKAFNLYGYSFTINNAKTVSSLVLPNNANVVVLAITLSGGAPSPGFTLSSSPSSQTATAGGTGSYTATVGVLNGFTGTVTLGASGLPPGTTASFNPASVSGAGTSAVSLVTTGSTPAGTYSVILTGTSGALQQTSAVTLVVNAPANFSLSALPSSQTVTAGGTGRYTATVGVLNGFTGTVTLGATGLPPGTTASFNPASVSGAGTSAVSLVTTGSTPAGTYTVTLTGTSGALQQTSTVTLVVSSTSGSGGGQVNLAAVFNRSGMVTDGTTFTSGGLDLGGHSYSANLLASFNGSSFTLGPANVLNVVTSTTIPLPAGQYSALAMLGTAVNGDQGSQTFVVNYSDGTNSTFVQSLSDWYTPQNYAGESKAATMAYRDVSDGTEDNRTFYLYGYSFALNGAKTASSITLPNNPNVAALAITLTPAALTPTFSLSSTPASQTVTAGGTGTYTATVGALNGFTGTVTLSASGLPSGTTASFNPASVSVAGTSAVSLLTTASTPAGTYTVTLTGTSGSLQQSNTLTLVVNAPGGSSGVAVSLAAQYNRSGIVTDGTTFTSGGLDMGGQAYSANLLGSTISFDGLSFTFGPPNVPDTVTSTTIPLPSGQYSTLAMLGTAVNGNQASQTFIVNYSDGTNSTFVQSLSDWYTPQSYPGESEAVTMPYRDVQNGTEDNRVHYLYGYSFALNGAKTPTSIALANNPNVVILAITLTPAAPAPSFTFSATPGSQTVTEGGTGSYTATIGALNGFTGTVTLSASGLPAGVTASFNPASVSGAGTSAVSLVTTASTPAGTYTVTLTGTSGALQQSSTVTLVVNAPANFSLSASPSSETVTAGGTATYTATVGALNGFSRVVSLTASGLPAGVTASFNPVSLRGAGTSTVSLLTSASTPAGTYTITLTGSGPVLTEATTVALVVNAPAVSSGLAVSLAAEYNRSGMVTDGSTFTSGGLDLGGQAYSANLLGSVVSFDDLTFPIGPPNVPDTVTSTTVPLPAGQYSTLAMLGTAVNGNQPSQTFIVNYSDGTNSTFVQSLSDWYTPQSYAGESEAATMAYRDVYNGTEDNRVHYLYGYSFALNGAKTATSIVLPNNANVVVLAITLAAPTGTPNFSLSATPGSQTVTAGGTGSYTATVGALNGFTGTVTLSASGLPAGTTASFNPASVSGAGTSSVSLLTTASTPAGTYTVTLTGTSGTLQQTTTVTPVVNAAVSSAGPVNLAASYNRTGIVANGTTFTSGGLDGLGYAYSATLLGSTVSFNASSFTLGPANAPDAVTSTTIPLPAGQYLTLALLATAVNGNQTSQTFVVNYSDGTNSTFVQSLSDWFTPQNYTGESAAVTMAYRDMANGTEDNRTFYLYGYSFALNSAKTATSITLPNNGDVVVLAITLAP